jgi:tRNA uridine 5-carbamoylmethylation protein Kti12
MIIWLNGAFGSGKTTCAFELHRRLPDSFVYDPENIGYWLRKMLPKELYKDDFQDYEEWRTINLALLRRINSEFNGTIIVPMTIVNTQYFNELIRPLIEESGLLHYILYASCDTLNKRLNRRLERGNTWAKKQIDRCVAAFDTLITEDKIITDNLTINEVAAEIAHRAGLELVPDTRSGIQKFFDRATIQIKHIRL